MLQTLNRSTLKSRLDTSENPVLVSKNAIPGQLQRPTDAGSVTGPSPPSVRRQARLYLAEALHEPGIHEASGRKRRWSPGALTSKWNRCGDVRNPTHRTGGASGGGNGGGLEVRVDFDVVHRDIAKHVMLCAKQLEHRNPRALHPDRPELHPDLCHHHSPRLLGGVRWPEGTGGGLRRDKRSNAMFNDLGRGRRQDLSHLQEMDQTWAVQGPW